MADAAVYARRVSFNEKLYLASERLQPGFCIQIVVEGEGDIAREALEAAVAAAARANPGARLVLRGSLGWMRWVAEGPVPPVRVVGGWNADRDVPAELERSLPPESGPTCEVVLAPGAPSRVVFRAFHGVMDARGLLWLAEDVFRALRGEPLAGSDFALNDTQLIESHVGHRTRPPIPSDRRTLTGSSASARSRVLWRRVSLAGAAPALVARIAVGLARHGAEHRAAPTRVMIPVDLRNYQREIRGTGNLTYPLLLDVAPERSWRDLQKDILKRLAAKEPMRLDPGERVVPWLPLRLLTAAYGAWTRRHRRTGLFPFTALVTHVALPDLGALDGGGFSARSLFFLPPQSDFIPLACSLVSSRGAAEIVVSAPGGLMDAPALDALCEAIRRSVAEDG